MTQTRHFGLVARAAANNLTVVETDTVRTNIQGQVLMAPVVAVDDTGEEWVVFASSVDHGLYQQVVVGYYRLSDGRLLFDRIE